MKTSYKKSSNNFNSSRKIKLGKKGEDIAEQYLLSKGFKIIFRNFRIHRGEIDIIAKEGEALVFIEVKTRTNLEFGEPIQAVNNRKVSQIRKTAEGFLLQEGENFEFEEIRFDILGILITAGKTEINHIKNAF